MIQAAAIYARISSDPDGTRLGVDRQVQDCRALADGRGWPVVKTFIDDDVSAYDGRPRPEYRRLLDAIKDGGIDAVVVWHLDRLHRHPKELEAFFETCDSAGVRDLASVSGDVDLSTDDGRFLARILGAVSRKESDDKSRRIRRKHEELAATGKLSGGGTRPFGYEQDRKTVVPSEAAVIREVADRVLSGDSLRSIARDLDSRGVATITGTEWSPTTLRNLVMSARISGQREHKGRIVTDAEWDPIVTPAQTDRLRAVLGDPRRRTSRTPRRYLLTGSLRCSLCGATLVARPRQDGRRRYVCATGPGFSGCGKIAVIADELEALIVEMVLYRLDTPELATALTTGTTTTDRDLADLSDRITQAEAQLEELALEYGNQTISMTEWLTARKPIEQRAETARKALSRLNKTTAIDHYIGQSQILRDAWTGLTLSRQKAIVAALLDRALISPAVRGRNRFDPSRVQPVWRM